MTPAELERVSELLLERQIDGALELVASILAIRPDDGDALLWRVKAFRTAGRLDAAAASLDHAAPRLARTGDPRLQRELAHERGFILMRQNRLEAALAQLEEAVRSDQPDVEHASTLCLVLVRLGRIEEAAQWRHRILRMRDAEAQALDADVVTPGRPAAFDPARRERNVVSYSLFGSDPFYHRCAMAAARMTPLVFPEFTARFYCAPDVPRPVLAALRDSGARVLISTLPTEDVSALAGTLWRFLAFDDPEVDVVLCRDVDSPILPRERAAIDLWLGGEAAFYCLRDHVLHAEPLLAGMWGGFTRVLPRLGPLIGKHIKSDHSRISDQRFLRTRIWPMIRGQAVLQIDSYASLPGAVDFPGGFPKDGSSHVGIGWTREQILGAHQRP